MTAAELQARIDADLSVAWASGAKPTVYWLSAEEMDLSTAFRVPESQIDRLFALDRLPLIQMYKTPYGVITLVEKAR